MQQRSVAIVRSSRAESNLFERRYKTQHASTEEIRKAYHKACLKYHPDKTGRGEEDEVFLLVKKAFDTLSDPVKRRSYDSTVDFDESIPAEGVKAEDFYKEYGPVFERNLRFASFNDPARHAKADKPSPTKKKGKGKGKNKGGNKKKEWTSCPPFGDDGSSLDDVHAFYDFWTHFESWRDFTLAAEKETEHDLDSADCRDEKRWMKQEVDRKMKKLKREEMARINLLVERAMAADPRLRREKERKIREKKEKEDAKRRAEEEKAERERVEREKAEAQAAKAKAVEESKKKDAKVRPVHRAWKVHDPWTLSSQRHFQCNIGRKSRSSRKSSSARPSSSSASSPWRRTSPPTRTTARSPTRPSGTTWRA